MASVPFLISALGLLTSFEEEIGLCTGFTLDSEGRKTPTGEPTGGGYARQVLAPTAWTTPARDGSTQRVFVETEAPIAFPTATAAQGTFTHAVIALSGGGETVDVVALPQPVTVVAGGIARIQPGALRRYLS